jgi:hypothetical protein
MPDDTTPAAAPAGLIDSHGSRLGKVEDALAALMKGPMTDPEILARLDRLEAALGTVETSTANLAADAPKDPAGRLARLEQRLVAAGFFSPAEVA